MNLSILLIVTAIIAIVTLLFALYVLRNMFIPTRGRRIGSYPAPTGALLVMDIQESVGSTQSAARPPPASSPFGMMIQNVNRLIECFDQAGLEVAYVRQVFSNSFITRLHGGRILSGSMEPRICRWVTIVNSNDFVKNRTDAFSNRQLEQFLIDRQVDEVFLVGLDAAFCVYYTALGALNRGYRVTIVTDAIISGRDMNRVLKRFREKGIRILDSREVMMAVKKDDGASVCGGKVQA